MNLQATYSYKEFELYAGIKNIFNFKPPSDSISRAFDPFDNDVDKDDPDALTFDPSYVYYSNQGINGFLGFRYHIK